MTNTLLLATLLVLCFTFCCGADAPFVTRHLQIPATPDNPRNSEGSFVALKVGSILLIDKHFMGGRRDASPASLVARRSTDGGKTWDDNPVEGVANEAKQNVMSVSLLRLKSGKIALFYLVKNSTEDARLHLRIS